MYKKNNREMMEKFKFDESYNQYFKARIKSSSDGTKVPGEDVLIPYMALMLINQ